MLRPLTTLLLFAAAVTLLSSCQQDDREVVLSLKFRQNQRLHYRSEIKKTSEIYENGKLVFTNSGVSRLKTSEEVGEVLGPDSAKVRLIYYETPAKGEKLSDSTMIEYIQNGRGLIVDFIREDSANLDMINYYQKLYEQMAPMYPEEPVSRGYTWNNTVKLLLGEDEITNATTTYKVRSLVRERGYDCAVVEYSGNTIVPFRYERNGVRIIRLDKRSAKGVFYLAYREGFIVKLEEIFDYIGEGTRYDSKGKIDFTAKENGTYSYQLLKAEGL